MLIKPSIGPLKTTEVCDKLSKHLTGKNITAHFNTSEVTFSRSIAKTLEGRGLCEGYHSDLEDKRRDPENTNRNNFFRLSADNIVLQQTMQIATRTQNISRKSSHFVTEQDTSFLLFLSIYIHLIIFIFKSEKAGYHKFWASHVCRTVTEKKIFFSLCLDHLRRSYRNAIDKHTTFRNCYHKRSITKLMIS